MPDFRYRSTSRLIIGLTVITIGVLFTLDSLGLADAHAALRWWPVALIAYGLTRLTGLSCRSAPFSGALFVVAGVWLLLNTLHVIDRSFWDLWPILLVIWGIAIVSGRGKFFGVTYRRGMGWKTYDRYPPKADATVGVGAIGSSKGAADQGSGYAVGDTPPDVGPRTGTLEDHSPNFSLFAFMGNVARKVVTQEFRGGDIMAMMGGGDIDLRSARMADGTARLEANLIMGGVNLFVPEDWSVEFQGLPIMASVEDRSKRPADASKGRLLITGVILMSSIIIRN